MGLFWVLDVCFLVGSIERTVRMEWMMSDQMMLLCSGFLDDDPTAGTNRRRRAVVTITNHSVGDSKVGRVSWEITNMG